MLHRVPCGSESGLSQPYAIGFVMLAAVGKTDHFALQEQPPSDVSVLMVPAL